MKKIVAFTSSRSDYDLLSYLYKLFHKDGLMDFRLLVSGAHLSPTYGMTVKHIEKDGIKILDKIETLIDSDSDSARIQTAANLLQGAIQAVKRFSPDLIIYAGDREDVIVAALVGGYLKIPTAHFFAGDHDEDGFIDNPVRHATSKLSTYKFVSIEEHKKRLLCIGENPKRIFVVGSCALDKFRYEPVLSKKELFMKLTSGRVAFNDYALVIFHPLMDYEKESAGVFRNILKALITRNIHAVVNVPNIDPGSRKLLNLMDNYKDNKNFIFINNPERNVFVNLYRHAAFQIGNSSAGILEAMSVHLPVVNAGGRMVGRKSQKNVIFVGDSSAAIEKGILTAISKEFFNKNVKGQKNIYGDGDSSLRAYRIIKKLDLSNFSEFRREDPLLALARKSR